MTDHDDRSPVDHAKDALGLDEDHDQLRDASRGPSGTDDFGGADRGASATDAFEDDVETARRDEGAN